MKIEIIFTPGEKKKYKQFRVKNKAYLIQGSFK